MCNATWYRKNRKIPISFGLLATFGSIWVSSKDQFFFSNSYTNFLWNYVVPGFLKNTDSESNVPGKQPKNSQSTRKLPDILIRRNERLVPVNKGVVSHYETNNLASNEPIEDRNSEYSLPNGVLFGVYDGHSGWQCAEDVMKRLPYYVALSMISPGKITYGYLSKLVGKVKSLRRSPDHWDNVLKDPFGKKAKEFFEDTKASFGKEESVEVQLKNAYKFLDEDIIEEAVPDVNDQAPEKILKGLSGACAITAYIQDSDLYIANSGDCRAVLGSKGPDGKWYATPLSIDQNVLNPEEVERLKLEHPGEESVVIDGRLLGHLQPLRAFGDVIFKWDSLLHERFLNRIYGREVISPKMYRTPPYLTAEPVVTHHKLLTNDKFLVIATDGLWDMISNEGAVQCIGELVESESLANDGDHTGSRQVNGASQLIQEALGGNDEVKVSRLLTAPKQLRRALRDDITVTVVYFTPRN